MLLFELVGCHSFIVFLIEIILINAITLRTQLVDVIGIFLNQRSNHFIFNQDGELSGYEHGLPLIIYNQFNLINEVL